MRPEKTRVLRKGLREARRGLPAGRKTREVKTTIGKRRQHEMWFAEVMAARRASEEDL